MSTYTQEDYKSGEGMLTTVWGPSLWHFLHTMSFNYPNEPTQDQKQQYMNFIFSLEHILPCKYCRMNLKKNFKVVPLRISNMKNRYTFSKYIYDLHEHINKMLNKKSGLSYDNVKERYEHFRARCNIKEKPKKVKITEKGCTESLYGKKSKCIIKIVPQTKKCNTFQMDDSCKKKRLKTAKII
jgi:hypothetical protein